MPYGNIHRFLLRTIASQSVISLEDTKNLVKQISGDGRVNIREIVQEINENIKPLKQMIKIVNDEVTSEELVVFLSLGYDDTSKAQNVFSPVELEFFRLLMEQIMTTDTREITDMTALNLANKVKVNNRLLSIVDAQRLLNVWCRMRYLEHQDKNYALGIRAIHEFESYFSKNMPVNMKCYMCTSIVFRGYNCPYCPETIHGRCLEEATAKNAQKWPCCKRPYVHSQLQELRGNSSRSNETQRSEQLEATQSMEVTQQSERESTAAVLDIEESQEDDMETDNTYSTRARKRRRLNS